MSRCRGSPQFIITSRFRPSIPSGLTSLIRAIVEGTVIKTFTLFSFKLSMGKKISSGANAGSKTLTSDTGGLEGYGYINEYPEAKIIKFSEEHGFLDLKNCKMKPSVGDIVTVIPNHVCVAVNMVDELIMVQNNTVIQKVPVAARGMLV